MSNTKQFGCTQCLPADADEAWEVFQKSEIDTRLIDESHFIVLLRACVSCGQYFVSVFTETIDWEHGEDPCFRTVLPITEQETATLKSADAQNVESILYNLDSNRQSLCRDWPRDSAARNFWSKGIRPHSHD